MGQGVEVGQLRVLRDLSWGFQVPELPNDPCEPFGIRLVRGYPARKSGRRGA